jgi:hypothetical protein
VLGGGDGSGETGRRNTGDEGNQEAQGGRTEVRRWEGDQALQIEGSMAEAQENQEPGSTRVRVESQGRRGAITGLGGLA